ncbi:MAG: GHKL domain-containing protein [Lachnospiraceae bacterium]|nr:GHKL domain-containing protein [Lachnospiraceae bacterium]
MEILRQLSMLWSLFHILILFTLLYRSKYNQKKTFFLTGITMGPLILLNIAGMVLLGMEAMGKLFIFTCTFPSLLFFYLISRDQKWRFLFTFCLADTAAYWVLIITNLLDFYLGGGKCVLMFLSRLVLFPILEWLAVRYLRKPYLELQDAVSKGWGIFAVMSAFYYILLIATTHFPTIITSRPQSMPVMILILILMPLTYATIFASLYRQLLLYRKQQEERIWQEQKQQLESRLENQQEIRRLKHDMKAHTITLSGLLGAGKIEEAQSYMQNMVQGYEEEMSKYQFCVNPYLNTIFSHFSQKFEEIGVELELELQIGTEDLPYMELCQILSNGLENAWDASKEIDDHERKVSLQMRYNHSYLIIRVKNRCRSDLKVEKGSLPNSTKSGLEHGFGLRTIQDSARRLNGEVLCYTKNEHFLLDVMVKV